MRKRLLCRAVEVPENGLKECEAEDGLKVVVANAGGEFFGFQAICPHQEGPLCEGLFDGSVHTCHMHLWQWDVRTGAPLGIRSEEHTSELQSQSNLVCRLLL